MKCFRCGNKLEIEYELDYPLVCNHCDENMFIFESVEEYENEAMDNLIHIQFLIYSHI